MHSLGKRIDPRATEGTHATSKPPFECVALLLQGGGAMGAYQGGVYQALAESNLHPNWVAGVSIGAINAAIIAGNLPQNRVEKLRAFWDRVTGNPLPFWPGPGFGNGRSTDGGGDVRHGWLDKLSAFRALVAGAPGFFRPRPPHWVVPDGHPASTSFYDTAALKVTLESLVDFDLLNSKAMRFSVGSVDVRTGNLIYFDTTTHTIRPEHIMASGALPPGFPAIEIDGEHYWDGGLVSNTPLQWVVDAGPRQDTLAFQVDLWSSRGRFPRDVAEVMVRQKEIQFSSRTRANTDRIKEMQAVRSALSTLLGQISEKFRQGPEAKLLAKFADRKVYNIVELIYRSKPYEGTVGDYEFSQLSMADHWRAGHDDAIRTLQHKEIFERPTNEDGFRTFDFDFEQRPASDTEEPAVRVVPKYVKSQR